MAHQIARKLHRGQHQGLGGNRSEAEVSSERACHAACALNVRALSNPYQRRHLRIVTTVPRPGPESISISSMSRRVPGKPSPSPRPEVNPAPSA